MTTMSKSENTQGSRKAPRTHNKAWADTTRAERQQKRLEALNAAARAAGWASWSAYETAVINGETQPTSVAADALCDCYISVPAGNYPDLCAHCGKKARR